MPFLRQLDELKRGEVVEVALQRVVDAGKVRLHGRHVVALHRSRERVAWSCLYDVLDVCPHERGDGHERVVLVEAAGAEHLDALIDQGTHQVAGDATRRVVALLCCAADELNPGAEAFDTAFPLVEVLRTPFDAEICVCQLLVRPRLAAYGKQRVERVARRALRVEVTKDLLRAEGAAAVAHLLAREVVRAELLVYVCDGAVRYGDDDRIACLYDVCKCFERLTSREVSGLSCGLGASAEVAGNVQPALGKEFAERESHFSCPYEPYAKRVSHMPPFVLAHYSGSCFMNL